MSSLPWDYIAKLVCIGDSGCGKSSLTIRLCEGRFVTHHDVTIGVEFGSRIVPVGPPYASPHKNTSAAAPLPPSSSSSSPSASSPPNANGTITTTATTSGLPPPPQPPAAAQQKHMKLSLWDTAGQETYKSVTRSYFRGASGALLVFDLTRRATFQHAIDWLNDLRQIAEPDIVVVLVGNKADLTWSPPLPRGGAEPGAAAAAAGLADTAAAATGTTGTGTGRASADGRGGGGGAGGGGATNQREVTRAEAEEWARRNGVLEYVETSAKSGENVEKAFMRVAERIFQNVQAGKYDLNDRRSGVKGPSAAGVGGSKPVRLTSVASSSRGGGCC